MRTWRLGFAGLGGVPRALLRLLEDRRAELERRHGLRFRITLAATRRRGALVAERGIDAATLRDGWAPGPDLREVLASAPIDLLFEATPLDPERGEPATSHVRAALERGVAVVSANKGPLAFAARDLIALARRTGAGFRFESAVADCLPIFDLVEVAVPVGALLGFRGVLNSTSNLVLRAAARGEDLAEAVADARRRGIAEADPAHDLDGWDQAVKAVVLTNVLFGGDLRPREVARTPLSEVDLDWVRREEAAGRTVRLAAAGGRGRPARVGPVTLERGSFLATLEDGSLGIEIETELAGTFRIASVDPDVAQTAYGMLTDLVAIHQGRPLAVPVADRAPAIESDVPEDA